MAKKLVAFFSASGVTKAAADVIAKEIGADVYEIVPEVLYTEADLNWRDKASRSSVEMNDKAFRPAMVDNPLDMTQYDEIFLGFPIWWYVAPTIVNTFLEKHDMNGKKVMLFATAGSSDWGNTAAELAVSAKGAQFKEGVVFKRGHTADDVLNWVKSL
ncbi:MAG: flavodoxin [Clostridia bacterium]|nr:flavodoxin [Clostridia bacterium]